MSERKREIHATAKPLVRWIAQAKISQAETARRLQLGNSQTVNNWLAHGVPVRRMFAVAKLCNMTIEEYRVAAGIMNEGAARSSVTRDTLREELLINFDSLPTGLQDYIVLKTREIKKYAHDLPDSAREAIRPPDDRRALARWEQLVTDEIISMNLDDYVPGAPVTEQDHTTI